jgi:hypothetical protein
VKEPGGGDVAEVGAVRRREAGVAGRVVVDGEREIDACGLVVGAAEGFYDEQIRVVGWQHDPVAAAEADEFAGLEMGSHA